MSQNPLPYHCVLRRQMGTNGDMLIEVYRAKRSDVDEDVRHFDALIREMHGKQLELVIEQAERHKDLLLQKIANLQHEEQRLERIVADLRAEPHIAEDGTLSDGDARG